MRARNTSPNEMTALDEQQLLGVATDGVLLRCVAEATKASKVARETLASERERERQQRRRSLLLCPPRPGADGRGASNPVFRTTSRDPLRES